MFVMLISHVAKAYCCFCICFSYCSLIVQVRNFETYSVACSHVSFFPFLISLFAACSVLHILQMLPQRKHGQCASHFQNMWLLLLQLLDLFSLRYGHSCKLLSSDSIENSFLYWHMESNSESSVVPIYVSVKDQWFEKSWYLWEKYR